MTSGGGADTVSYAGPVKVYVLHENPDWFAPIAAALQAAGVPYSPGSSAMMSDHRAATTSAWEAYSST